MERARKEGDEKRLIEEDRVRAVMREGA